MIQKHNQPNDSIERLLNKALSNFEPEAPVHSWDQISKRLDKRKKRIAFFWYSVSAIAILGIFYGFRMNSNSPLNLEFANQKNQIVSINTPVISNSAALNIVTLNPESTNQIGKLTTGTHADIQKFKKSFRSNSSNSLKVNNRVIPEMLFISDTRSLIEERNLFSIPLIIQSKIMDNQTSLLQSMLLNDPIDLPTGIYNAKNNELNDQLEEKKKTNSLFWIGPKTAGYLVHTNYNLSASHGQVFSTKQNLQFGLLSGINIQYQWTKNWTLGTGLEYQEYNTSYEHQATLRLLDATLVNPNDPGLKNYAFQYTYSTPLSNGSIDIEMAELNHPSTMSIDEPFIIEMSTQQLVNMITLPIYIQRNIGAKKVNFLISTGVDMNYYTRVKNSIVHYNETCKDLCFASSHTPIVNNLLKNRFSINGTFGFGVRYQINKRIKGSLIPEYKIGAKGSQNIGIQTAIYFKL